MDNHSRMSSNFRPKSKCVQFYVTCLGKSFIVYGKLREWLVLSADSGNKNFTYDCEERLYLKVNTVIGHEMMYVPQKHIAIIMGLKPRPTVQRACTRVLTRGSSN